MTEKSLQTQLSLTLLIVAAVGLAGLAFAFAAHRFLALFVSAGSIWVVALLVLHSRFRPGIFSVPGRKKMFRGIAVALGLVVFAATWYLIVKLDPSLR